MKNYYYEINPVSDCYKEIQQYYIEKSKWFNILVRSEIGKLLNTNNIDEVACVVDNLIMENPPNILIKQFKNKINRNYMFEARLNSEIYKEWKNICKKYELKNIDIRKIFEKYKLYPMASEETLIRLNNFLLIKSVKELTNDFLIEVECESYEEAKEKV